VKANFAAKQQQAAASGRANAENVHEQPARPSSYPPR
jgi:hypothetical protein